MVTLVTLGDFLCIPTLNTGQLNPLFHTFAEFRLIVNRIVAWQSTDWLAANAQFSPNDEPTNFSAATIIGVIIVDEFLLVWKLISVQQIISVVQVLICEITVITVKTFEKTRMFCFCSKTLSRT